MVRPHVDVRARVDDGPAALGSQTFVQLTGVPEDLPTARGQSHTRQALGNDVIADAITPHFAIARRRPIEQVT